MGESVYSFISVDPSVDVYSISYLVMTAEMLSTGISDQVTLIWDSVGEPARLLTDSEGTAEEVNSNQ